MLRHLSIPSDEAILGRLQAALSSEPITEADRQKYIANAALDLVAILPTRDYLEQLESEYNRVRPGLIALWPELDFSARMLLRESAKNIRLNLGVFELLPEGDRQALLAAMDESSRDRYEMSRRVHFQILQDVAPLIESDPEVRSAITAEEVWNTVKRLDPKMEEALRKPLDRSKYVKRDLRATPRRSA